MVGLPWWLRGQSAHLHWGRPGFNPWDGKIAWRRKWQPTPVLLPGKSNGRRNLGGCRPGGHKESDTTEWLHFPLLLLHWTIFLLRYYNPGICFWRELDIRLPCLTSFHNWYLQNKVLTPWSRMYTLSLPALPASSRCTHPNTYFAGGDWLYSNFSCSLMALHTCRVTSQNILLRCVHLAGSHSSSMTHFEPLLSGNSSLRPRQQEERSPPLLLSQASSSHV